jgi:hypothetical protein
MLREKGRDITRPRISETPNHDAVFALGTGLGQDLAVGVQVLIKQLQ